MVVSEPDRQQLEARVRSRSLPRGRVRRARIVLLSAEGVPHKESAARRQVSALTVPRVWPALGLRSHRQDYFKLSPDPFCIEKVRDVVGLTGVNYSYRSATTILTG